MHLHAVVVMPEHVHLLLTPMCNAEGWPFPLKDILKLIKGPAARSVNLLNRTHGALWQDQSFDHVLRSNESFDEKLEYIRQNPIRRGLVAKPEDYEWLWVEGSELGQECPRHTRKGVWGGHSCPPGNAGVCAGALSDLKFIYYVHSMLLLTI